MRVAVAQFAPAPGDLAGNAALHLAAIEAARGRGADLLAFPELSLTGYLADPSAGRLALAPDDAPLIALARAAGPIAVSVGFVARGEGGTCRNAQALLLGGEVLAVHHKLNLPHYGRLTERDAYAPGDDLAPAALPGGWRAATLICADAWNPALTWLAALGGANLLLVPAASARGAVGEGFDTPRGWDLTLAHAALTYGVPVVFANHRGGRFWGGSRVLDASGTELARAGDAPELIVADLDADHGRAARATLPTVRDADPALVARLLARHLRETP